MPEAHEALTWPELEERRNAILREAIERWSDWLQFPGGVLMVTSLGVWPLRDPAPPARPPEDA